VSEYEVGQDGGYISHVNSTYPASVGGVAVQVAAPTITHTKKSCLAGPAATNDTLPSPARPSVSTWWRLRPRPSTFVDASVHARPHPRNRPVTRDA